MPDHLDQQLQSRLDAASKLPDQHAAMAPPNRKTMAPPRNTAQSLAPAAHQRVERDVIVADDFSHPTAFQFGFLGSGQGGARLANAFWQLGYRRVSVFNTTASDFDGLPEEMAKLDLEVGGAAKDTHFARKQLAGRDEEVWELLTRSWGKTVECGLICACLGGGTGSGTAAPLVELARKYLTGLNKPPRVGAVVSLPPVAEGQQICRNAVNALKELLTIKASPLIVLDNSKVAELYRPSMLKLHPTCNSLVARLLHEFNYLAADNPNNKPLRTFDKSELGHMLDGGLLVMGAADIQVSEITSPADIAAKIRDELVNNVLASVDLKLGKRAACLFVGEEAVLDSLPLDYLEAGFTQINRVVGSGYKMPVDVIVHPGIYVGEPGSGLQAYVAVSDLHPPMERLAELSKMAGLPAQTAPDIATFLGVAD